MRASRLLHMLLILQNRGRQTARQLAVGLEVSPRTILRDAEALQEAGIPLKVHRGTQGGIECDEHSIGPLIDSEAVHIAAYIEQMIQDTAPQTVKQRLAAIKALFDFLVMGGVLAANPASAVRGPRHSTAKGKTSILMADVARALINSIPVDTLPGLRDRAIIVTMTYSFARVSATLGMDVKDVFSQHHRLWCATA